MAERNTRSPMSRTSLYRPRRPRAVWDRPATDTRLLPTPHSRLAHSLRRGIPLALSQVEGSQERNGRSLLPSPFPPITPHLDSHYKRCPKALRLRLRSDQSSSRPLHGRFPDKSRHTLSHGRCQVRTPLTRRIRLASSGDALERSVMSLPQAIAPPRAIAPFSDSPGADLAGPVRTVVRRPTQNQRTIFGFHRRHNRRTSDYERRSRVPAPIPQAGRALPVDGTAPHREFLGSRSTSPQKFGAVAEPSPM